MPAFILTHDLQMTFTKKRQRKGDPKAPFQYLKDLSVYPELHKRIASGESPKALTAWLVDDLKLCTGKTRAAIQKMLYRYKDSLPLKAFDDPKTSLTPLRYHEKVLEYDPVINEIKELEELIAQQRSRIMIDFDLEKTVKKLLPSTRAELLALEQMVVTLFKLKQEVGMYMKMPTMYVPGDGGGTLGQANGFGKAVDDLINNPESRAKVLTTILTAAKDSGAGRQVISSPRTLPQRETLVTSG